MQCTASAILLCYLLPLFVVTTEARRPNQCESSELQTDQILESESGKHERTFTKCTINNGCSQPRGPCCLRPSFKKIAANIETDINFRHGICWGDLQEYATENFGVKISNHSLTLEKDHTYTFFDNGQKPLAEPWHLSWWTDARNVFKDGINQKVGILCQQGRLTIGDIACVYNIDGQSFADAKTMEKKIGMCVIVVSDTGDVDPNLQTYQIKDLKAPDDTLIRWSPRNLEVPETRQDDFQVFGGKKGKKYTKQEVTKLWSDMQLDRGIFMKVEHEDDDYETVVRNMKSVPTEKLKAAESRVQVYTRSPWPGTPKFIFLYGSIPKEQRDKLKTFELQTLLKEGHWENSNEVKAFDDENVEAKKPGIRSMITNAFPGYMKRKVLKAKILTEKRLRECSYTKLDDSKFCSSGCYRGNCAPGLEWSCTKEDLAASKSEDACKKQCDAEDECLFIAYSTNVCSRFNEDAGDCSSRIGSGHTLYKKTCQDHYKKYIFTDKEDEKHRFPLVHTWSEKVDNDFRKKRRCEELLSAGKDVGKPKQYPLIEKANENAPKDRKNSWIESEHIALANFKRTVSLLLSDSNSLMDDKQFDKYFIRCIFGGGASGGGDTDLGFEKETAYIGAPQDLSTLLLAHPTLFPVRPLYQNSVVVGESEYSRNRGVLISHVKVSEPCKTEFRYRRIFYSGDHFSMEGRGGHGFECFDDGEDDEEVLYARRDFDNYFPVVKPLSQFAAERTLVKAGVRLDADGRWWKKIKKQDEEHLQYLKSLATQ